MANDREPRIRVTRNGPYRVEGDVPLAQQTIVADQQGQSRDWAEGQAVEVGGSYELCRCGHSSNKPFCDRTHARVGFDGTEVASREPYRDQAGMMEGPTLDLTDAESLCASGRFCDPDGSVWRLIEETDNAEVRAAVERMVGNCPSGRLVVWARESGEPEEPSLTPSIGLVEDPVAGVSGPLWVRGEIVVESSDGTAYERRNRVTLCRCGASGNKPFCDGSHIRVGFRDDG
jgi:CDGSH-type Zn-finger protein